MLKACDAISSYIMGKGGDALIDRASLKRKVRGLAKKEKKYIRNVFKKSKYIEYPVEQFFFEKVFSTGKYLYPFETIPKDKSQELYEEFRDYVLKSGMDPSTVDEDEDFKSMLEGCVENHNVLVRQTIWSPAIQLAVKDIKDYMTATGFVGNTLDSDAEVLSDNAALEYTHRQINGVLHALRMDLRFYRLMLIVCTIGLMVVAPTFVALYARYKSPTIAIIAAVLGVIALVAVLPFGVVTWRKILYCEKTIQKYTELLWENVYSEYSLQLRRSLWESESIDNYWPRLYSFQEFLDEKRNYLDRREARLDEREKRLQEQENTEEDE